MLKNVRVPIPAQMFTNARRETSASLADVTGITFCTLKLADNARTEIERNRILNSRATIRPLASAQVQQAISTYYFKLPYVGSFTRETQKRLRKLVLTSKLSQLFFSFKIGSMFSDVSVDDLFYNVNWEKVLS